ncbi:hypothetical protein [Comamonas sp.]|uniref:hypothetical protein n=1 Tax=Comamonas sp. TaxID=34028 RepID=UPI00258974E4|nr:hypothetical protein [Comamonas sp.]
MSTNELTKTAAISPEGLLFSLNAGQVTEAIKASGCSVTPINIDGVPACTVQAKVSAFKCCGATR